MLRTDLWVAAFVRRHNDIGHICVVARRGDPVAGQVFIEIDHLNGTHTLLTPAPSYIRAETGSEDHIFIIHLLRKDNVEVRKRIAREVDFDPDLWVIALEMRGDDAGVTLVNP